jgi:hypothetical protein
MDHPGMTAGGADQGSTSLSTTTVLQMMGATVNALYVMPDHRYIGEARALARNLGRHDLSFSSPDNLRAWRGKKFPAIVIDHEAQLEEKHWEYMREIIVP